MREFNLEEAKAGKPVCTRDGRDARIICWDRMRKDYPIVALIKRKDGVEEAISFTTKGTFYNDGAYDEIDLMMRSEKHEGWVITFKLPGNKPTTSTGQKIYDYEADRRVFLVREIAEEINQKVYDGEGVVTRIEWEE